jgi:hypothetical protein
LVHTIDRCDICVSRQCGLSDGPGFYFLVQSTTKLCSRSQLALAACSFEAIVLLATSRGAWIT